jgi:hypothetical protein
MNFDLTNERLLVPTALFILLSPGLILSLPSIKIASMETNPTASIIHALVFVLLYFGLSKLNVINTDLTKADLIVPAVLFLALNVMMKTTSPMQIAVRALIFFVVFAVLRQVFSNFY